MDRGDISEGTVFLHFCDASETLGEGLVEQEKRPLYEGFLAGRYDALRLFPG